VSVQPFDVSVPRDTLDDLRERLKRTRFPDEVSGAGWDYGANLAYLRELADYWRDGFDRRKQEAELNRFAHFRAEIGGFGVHFVHERGEGPNPRRSCSPTAGPTRSTASTRSSRCSRTRRVTAATPPTRSTWWSLPCRATASRTGRPSVG
jgi:hypothetical protein